MNPAKPFFILAIVNGILTDPDNNWTDWMRDKIKKRFPDAIVIQQEYFGLPLPWYQTFIANQRIAGELAEKLKIARETYGYDVPMFIWAHSNGGPVAVDALSLFPEANVKCLILMAAACHASVKRSGIRWLYEHLAIGRAVAWHNKKDVIIGLWARLAGWLTLGLTWGRLGEIGFQDRRKGEPFENYRDPHPDHSDNLSPRYIEETIDVLLQQSFWGMVP